MAIEHRSPLARSQAARHVEAAIGWVRIADALGPQAAAHIDRVAVLEYLTDVIGLPAMFMQSEGEPQNNLSQPPHNQTE